MLQQPQLSPKEQRARHLARTPAEREERRLRRKQNRVNKLKKRYHGCTGLEINGRTIKFDLLDSLPIEQQLAYLQVV